MEAGGGRKYPRTEKINMAEGSGPLGRSQITQYMVILRNYQFNHGQDGFVYVSGLILGDSKQVGRHGKDGEVMVYFWVISQHTA